VAHTSLKQHWLAVIALSLALCIVVGLLLLQTGVIQIAYEKQNNATSTVTNYPALIVPQETATTTEAPNTGTQGGTTTVQSEYIEVTNGCDIHFNGDPCLNVRSGPGTEFPVLSKLRNNVVLKVGAIVENEGHTWYKIVFDEYLRYPERVAGDWYVAGDYVRVFNDDGDKTSWEDGAASTTKKIIVDRSEQKLYAYDGNDLFMEIPISTGLALTPTPRGTFTVYKKTPSRYMQGPLPGLPSDQYYDLPGVPWNLYFTQQGAVIHGAYWHNSFGHPYSHGCVNLLPSDAEKLYSWAPIGTTVIVRD
jgi:lipoprotein-anchoring transpeptidase ErfK/SrfK